MNYKGVIIEESLKNTFILKQLHILKTRREKVTPKHKTTWLTQWTLHAIEIPEIEMDTIATILSDSIETQHSSSWYMDFKNDRFHYIIFKNKVFKVNLDDPHLYKNARNYGLTTGMPLYQMQFEKLKRKLK